MPATGTTADKAEDKDKAASKHPGDKGGDYTDEAGDKRHAPTVDERLKALEAIAGVGPGSAGYQDAGVPDEEEEG